MTKLDTLLLDRLEKKATSTKVTALAKQAQTGSLSSFAGLFGTDTLSEKEKKGLEELLNRFAPQDGLAQKDLESIISITQEVKAIQHQAVLLHGQRIKQAQQLLKRYRDGAFSSWLMLTYGNRQTPYNFLVYYEFVSSLTEEMKQKISQYPRQVIYSLASRAAPFEKKEKFLNHHVGKKKEELLEILRSSFPLDEEDKRKRSVGESFLADLAKFFDHFQHQKKSIKKEDQAEIKKLLKSFLSSIE